MVKAERRLAEGQGVVILWGALDLRVTKLYLYGPKIGTPSPRQSGQC